MELAVAHDHQDHHNFIMMGSSSTDLTHLIFKGKRTKRQRSSSPSSCSSSRQLELGLVVANYGSTSTNSASSPTTTSSTDQEQDQVVVQDEEEDMANCLILLAQGHHHNEKQPQYPRKNFEKLPPPPPAIITKSGFYVYECKTCNRTFPSFQALGGHRASHKKPKVGGAGADEKKGSSVNTDDVESNCQLNKSCSDHHLQLLPQLPNYNNNNKGSGGNNLNFQLGNSNSHKGNKIHECSICGSEFMSGQALGGHMRRHRAAAPAPPNSSVDGVRDQNQKEMIKPRSSMLGLDLNLPAPEDEHQQPQQSKFQFVSSKQQTASLVLAAPALVDCHY